MKHLTMVIILLHPLLWGIDNYITVKEMDSTAVTNAPVQIGRAFVQGDIKNYPQAVMNGTLLTTQADVKLRWPDGSVKHAVVSFIIPSLASGATQKIYFRDQPSGNNTALTLSQMLDAAYDFDAVQTYAPTANCSGCTTYNISARDILEALSTISTCTGSNASPCLWTSGSVAQTVILADHVNKTYDVGWIQADTSTVAASFSTSATSLSVTDGTAAAITVPAKIRLVSQSGTQPYLNLNDYYISQPNELVAVCGKDESASPDTLAICQIQTYARSGSSAPYTVTITTGDGTTEAAHPFKIGDIVLVPSGVGASSNALKIVSVPTTTTFTAYCVACVSSYSSGGSVGRRLWFSNTGLNSFGTTAYVFPDSWTDASALTNRPIRPTFHATFWPALNKVFVRYMGEITDTEKLADQQYSLTLTLGYASPTTVYTQSEVLQGPGNRWSRTQGLDRTTKFWTNAAPAELGIDHNLAYLQQTGLVQNFHPDKTYDPSIDSAATAELSAWNANGTVTGSGYYPDNNNHKIGGAGSAEFSATTTPFKKMASSGGDSGSSGNYPVVVDTWLKHQTRDWWRFAVESSELGTASIPMHYREGSATRKATRTTSDGCTSYCDQNGIGLPITPVGRGSLWGMVPSHASYSERLTVLSGGSTFGWVVAPNHLWDPWSVLYLVSGDYYWLEELQFAASISILQAKTGATITTAVTTGDLRGPYGTYGTIPTGNCATNGSWYDTGGADGLDDRWNALPLRLRVNAAALTPTGTVASEWLEEMMDDMMASGEGTHNIAPSKSTTAYMAAYNWAKTYLGGFGSTATNAYRCAAGSSPLQQWWAGNAGYATGDSSGQWYYGVDNTYSYAGTMWNQHQHLIAYGRAAEMGFSSASAAWQNWHYLDLLTNSSANPYLFRMGRMPTKKVSDGKWIGSWAEFISGFETAGYNSVNYQTLATMDANSWQYYWGWPLHGWAPSYYLHRNEARAVTARQFLQTNLVDEDDGSWASWAFTRQWAWPRWAGRNIRVEVTSTTAVIRYTAPDVGACAVSVATSSDFSTGKILDATSDGGGNFDRSVVTSGLSAGTNYYLRVDCELDSEDQEFRSGSSAGGIVHLSLAPPTGATQVTVDYGDTSALGSTTTISCSSSCIVSLPTSTVGVVYWKNSWLDADNVVLSQSVIQTTVRR